MSQTPKKKFRAKSLAIFGWMIYLSGIKLSSVFATEIEPKVRLDSQTSRKTANPDKFIEIVVNRWVDALVWKKEAILARETAFPFSYTPLSMDIKCGCLIETQVEMKIFVGCIHDKSRLLLMTLKKPPRPDLNTIAITKYRRLSQSQKSALAKIDKRWTLVSAMFLGDGVNYDLIFAIDDMHKVRMVVVESEFDMG